MISHIHKKINLFDEKNNGTVFNQKNERKRKSFVMFY